MRQIRLSNKTIVRSREDATALRDTLVPTLLVRFGKDAKPYFHCRLYKSGQSTSVCLGGYPEVSIDAARQAAKQLIEKQRRERLQLKGTGYFDRVEQVLQWYLECDSHYGMKAGSTMANIAHRINAMLIPTLADKDVRQLSLRLLHDVWLIPLLERYSPATIQGAFQTLKSALRLALQKGYIPDNPLADITFYSILPVRLKPADSMVQSKSLQQVCALITALPDMYKMLALLCLCCLTRNSETCKAKWADFDFNEKVWSIPAINTKTGVSISIPISSELCRSLKTFKQKRRKVLRSIYVFPKAHGRGHISASYAAQQISLYSRKRLRLHDLRKFGSSSLRDSGADYYLVERIMNHRKTVLDETYIHTSLQIPMRKVLERWQATIHSAMPAKN